MNPHRLRAYLYLLVVAAIWGIAGPVIKFTLGGIAPLPFLTYRFGLSAFVAVIFLKANGAHIPKDNKTFLQVLFYSFLVSTVALGLLFLGLNKTTVLDMTLITTVGPLLIALSGVIFLKEHVTSREKVGMAIAFSGTLFTVFESLFKNGVDLNQLTGNSLVVLYLLTNSFSAVLVKKLVRKDIAPLTLTNFSFIVGFLTITPLALFTHGAPEIVQSIKGLGLAFHLGIFYMALLSGNLAYTLWVKGQKTIEIGEAALFAYLYPLFSMPLAVLWLKEKITLPFVIGALLIAIGVVIAEYKKPQRKLLRRT